MTVPAALHLIRVAIGGGALGGQETVITLSEFDDVDISICERAIYEQAIQLR